MQHAKGFGCRGCGHFAAHSIFLSFGTVPLGNSLVIDPALSEPDVAYPLELAFCDRCSLVQVAEAIPFERLIEQNLYFTSSSPLLVRQGEEQAQCLVDSRRLGGNSLVVEIGSNDGALLKCFARRGVQVLGIEPVAQSADLSERSNGIPTIRDVFTNDLAERLKSAGKAADVIIANYLLELVPDLPDFARGIRTLLARDGLAIFDVPYVRRMIEQCRFDGIAHLRLSWFSVTSLDRLFRQQGLSVVEAEFLPNIRGGTLRFSVSKGAAGVSKSVASMLQNETEAGVASLAFYESFGQRVRSAREAIHAFLQKTSQDEHKHVAAYGAGIKASMLLNLVGLNGDIIDFVVDRNSYKHGRYLPGVRLPICPPEKLLDKMPDYTLLLALDFVEEVLEQQREYRKRGGKFIIPVPELTVV